MNNSKIKDLNKEILEFKIPYRKDLKFASKDTFGCEIEFYDADYSSISQALKSLKKKSQMFCWDLDRDETVYIPSKTDFLKGKGGELISPILFTENHTFDEMITACNLIKSNKGTINYKTAGHIHAGGQMFESKEKIDNFLLLWSIFEDVIERFFCGEFLENSYLEEKAHSCRDNFKEASYDKYNLSKIRLDKHMQNENKIHQKAWAVSFYYFYCYDFEPKNTIEFRKISGTLEPAIWQNNCYFLSKFASLSNKISKKELNYIKTKFDYSNKDSIDIKKAIFLSDLMFETDLDKLCFLKQYIKDFHIEKTRNKTIKLVR